MKYEELIKLLQEQKENYCDIEIYMPLHNGNLKAKQFLTDYIVAVDEYNNQNIIDYQLMDECKYNNTILANSCIDADFQEWYDNKNVKILVILIEKDTITGD